MTLKTVRQTAQLILNALGFPEAELSLVIMDDVQIARLNARYLKRRGPTNVIAFPMQEGEFAAVTPALLGDVAISVETARKEAAAAGVAFKRRFDELLIHGILHLAGYDHEKGEMQAQVMEKKTKELLRMLDDNQPAGSRRQFCSRSNKGEKRRVERADGPCNGC